MEHLHLCQVGDLSARIEALFAWQQRQANVQSNPNRKESVAAANLNMAGPVGTPVQPKGLADRVCLNCGTRGGIWEMEFRPESEVELAALALNQCVSAGAAGIGHTRYTHLCGGLGGAA